MGCPAPHSRKVANSNLSTVPGDTAFASLNWGALQVLPGGQSKWIGKVSQFWGTRTAVEMGKQETSAKLNHLASCWNKCVATEPTSESYDHIIIYPRGSALVKLLIKVWNNFVI